MGTNTKIEWAHHTFNPWIGCTKIGLASENYCKKALRWNRQAGRLGVRRRVLCGPNSDIFDHRFLSEWLADLMRLVSQTPNLDWLLLTKNVGNAQKMLEEAVGLASRGMFGWSSGGGWERFKNLWLGVTVCNQEEADRDIPKLLAIPAAKRFLSIEPLLGPINCLVFTSGEYGRRLIGAPQGINWVIVGGGDRPMHPAWVRYIRNQCNSAGVPFLFKQWGDWGTGDEFKKATAWVGNNGEVHILGTPYADELFERAKRGERFHQNFLAMERLGKKAAGRILDGRTWDEVPE